MDTTETYIKMCDCEEIQKQKPRMGLVPPTNEDTFISLFACYWAGDFDWVKQQSRYIWLPRQDQLQEMYYKSDASPMVINCSDVVSVFNDFCRRYWLWGKEYKDQFGSMEQLWLAFVLKENHGKTWNGEEWVDL